MKSPIFGIINTEEDSAIAYDRLKTINIYI